MRISGILLHPTSLPGGHGIGDLGDTAYRFVDFLVEGGMGLWQVLPLGPPAEANSPYKCYSSMAGNPLLVSLERLEREGLLSKRDLGAAPAFPPSFVDFEAVAPYKWKLLRKAGRTFLKVRRGLARDRFEQFCEERKYWLDEFAQFATLKKENSGAPWPDWRRTAADPDEVLLQKYVQFEFFRQWDELKRYCNDRNVTVMGDLPIFVAHDSADVWGHPALFDLDGRGYPRMIAGVPPDYFSATGQRWGNPLYRWDAMAAQGYEWWIERVRSMLTQFDLIRLDHFRGFEKYYQIPCDAPTAIEGTWVEGPGDALFQALEEALGKLPFVAEDLGMITPEVLALRDRWNLPGMRVLQFAFCDESPQDLFKPYNFIGHCVAYTGTHDNDTTAGWFSGSANEFEREFALRYLHSDGREIHWDFVRAVVSSVADIAIFPLQDVLGLGSEARMNMPARAEGNWRWRLAGARLRPEISGRLREMNRTYGRLPAEHG